MVKFLLFRILLVLCWPLALVALVPYPLVWLVLLPFRIIGSVAGSCGVHHLPTEIIVAVHLDQNCELAWKGET